MPAEIHYVQAGTSIQPVLTAAAAGDTVVLGNGTFTENAGLEIPDNVNLRGLGKDVSIIQSNLVGTSAPFHGIVAPGNNSVISDLAIKTTANAGVHSNAISRRAGCTKTWTNVLVTGCHLTGAQDVVFAGGVSLGDMTFVDCFLEGPCDIFIWQSASKAVLLNCVLQHTTATGFESLSFTGIYDGGSGGSVKAYGSRYILAAGVTSTNGGTIVIEAGSHVELHDFVLDYQQPPPGSYFDLGDDGPPTSLFVSNVRRADGNAWKSYGAIKFFSNIVPTTVAALSPTPVVGQIAAVTDGTAALAWGATVTGGSTTKYVVMWNGTNWTVMGK